MGNCQPFAIMRLTHEAIRSGLKEIKELISDKYVDVEKLKATFNDIKRVIQLHASQEEAVFYVELSKKKKGVTSHFTSEHEEEKLAFETIDDLMNDVNSDETQYLLIDLLNSWVDNHLEHLIHEEEGLMNLLPELFTYVESVQVVRLIIEYDLEEFEHFQLKWVYDRLNSKQKEVYLGMLKGCSPANKFEDFLAKLTIE